MKIALVLALAVGLSSCSNETWTCQIRGKTMYSINASGELGGAGKGCSCAEIRLFELRTFGEVDEAALKSDFGC
jgi:hypothetical protein